jgi:hypothetical protein
MGFFLQGARQIMLTAAVVIGRCGPPIKHLPYSHGPTQLSSFVSNVITRHHWQCLHASLGQKRCSACRPLNIARPYSPGDLYHQVDFGTILAPLSSDHHIGPADFYRPFFRQEAIPYCIA